MIMLYDWTEHQTGPKLEVTMKDLHTVGGQPHRMTEWAQMARQPADQYA